MIPLEKVKQIVDTYKALEKELASGDIDKKDFVKKSKENKLQLIKKDIDLINKILNKDTLIVVDDTPATANLSQSDPKSKQAADTQQNNNGLWQILKSPAPTIGGKGFLVHEYASHVEAKLVFSHYQAAWNGFNKG